MAGGVWRFAQMVTAVYEVGAALFGACVGSFLNVVVHRLPQEDPARRSLGGRSRCPGCGKPIRWYDNLPVLAWFLLRGRARCCGGRISFRYPLVELLTAGLFLLLAVAQPFGDVFRPGPDGTSQVHGPSLAAQGFQAVFVALLVANTFIDIDTQLLLDALTKPGMAIGLLGGLWPGVAGPLSAHPEVPPALDTLLASLAGLAVGGGVTWAIRIVGTRVFRREAMGFGDVKFLAMIGAFLGWRPACVTMLLACLFGAVIGGAGALFRGTARIPFGPYLALGASVALFATDELLDFLFVAWPEWQRSSPAARWFLPVLALFSFVALIVLVRRGRRPG